MAEPKRSLGNIALLRELFILVGEDVTTVNAGNQVDIELEVKNDLNHWFYICSAYCDDAVAAIDTYFTGSSEAGSGGGGNSGGLHASVFTRRQLGTAATEFLEVRLLLANNTGANRDINWKVYRIAGLI